MLPLHYSMEFLYGLLYIHYSMEFLYGLLYIILEG